MFDVCLDLAIQPRSRVSPVAFGRGFRKAKHLGSFFNRQADEKSELHQLGLDGVMRGQTIQRLVQREQLIVAHAGGEFEGVEIESHPFGLAAVAQGFFAPRVVNQDAAHGFSRGGEKMGAILPGGLLVPAEAKPRLVNQRGGLKRLARSFAGHLLRGEFAQFVIDQRQQPVGRPGIARLDLLQHDREVAHEKTNTGFRSGKEARNPNREWFVTPIQRAALALEFKLQLASGSVNARGQTIMPTR